jgi:cytochrome c oxidase subunit 3
MTLWWRDTIRESSYLGCNTNRVKKGIYIGFILFVISEICFFISIFWAFFHSSLAPSVELGCLWPSEPKPTPWEVPSIATLVLLSSGASVTWSHHS